MHAYEVKVAPHPLNAVVRVPGSKSLTNRALIAAALADGPSTLQNILLADDTRHMIDALRSLGVALRVDESACRAEITGAGGYWRNEKADLFCGNAGTVMRFLAAACSVGHGQYHLDGVPRMRERPIGALVDALIDLGAYINYLEKEGYPPIDIRATGLRGGTVRFQSPQSSQLVSALLLAAPYAGSDVFIEIAGQVVSQPYLDMTVSVMDAFGVAAVADGMRFIVPAPQRYHGTAYAVEPDASNASYFLAAPAIAGGSVIVEGLGTSSVQGDVGFVDLLERMGCRIDRSPDRLTVTAPPPGTKLRGIDVDLNAMPDTAQTLAVLALFASSPTRIRNIANLRVKETDRIAALATELTRLGAQIEIFEDGLAIHPPKQIQPTPINTYDDHRMAMSFALVGLAVDGIVINDPECVNKTFPDYFECLEQMSAQH